MTCPPTYLIQLTSLLLLSAAPTIAQTTLAGTVRDAADKLLEGILPETKTKTQLPATAFAGNGAAVTFAALASQP